MMRFSVIIPTHNRRELASRCVASVLAQKPAPHEVLVVDNDSSDGTRSFLSEKFPGRLRILTEKRRDVSRARNRGIDHADGDVLAFIDDDAQAEPGWLAAIASCLEETRGWGAGGPALPIWESPPPRYILDSPKARSYIGAFSLGEKRKRLEEFRDFLIGTNCAFRREVFDRGLRFLPADPPWPRVMEDLEFSRRVAALFPVYYDPDIRVHHHIPARKTNLRHLARIGFDNGIKKAIIGRRLSPRGACDLWGVDGWISLFSATGYLIGKLRLSASRLGLA